MEADLDRTVALDKNRRGVLTPVDAATSRLEAAATGQPSTDKLPPVRQKRQTLGTQPFVNPSPYVENQPIAGPPPPLVGPIQSTPPQDIRQNMIDKLNVIYGTDQYTGRPGLEPLPSSDMPAARS